MTYLDYFVAAYWFSKGKDHSFVKRVIRNGGEKYRYAKEELSYMRKYRTHNEINAHISEHLQGYLSDNFNRDYLA